MQAQMHMINIVQNPTSPQSSGPQVPPVNQYTVQPYQPNPTPRLPTSNPTAYTTPPIQPTYQQPHQKPAPYHGGRAPMQGGRSGGCGGRGQYSPHTEMYFLKSPPSMHQNTPSIVKRYNNYNYFWTHGCNTHDHHTSATYHYPAYNHNYYAACANMMGGSKRNISKTCLPVLGGQQGGQHMYQYWNSGAAGFNQQNKILKHNDINSIACTPPQYIIPNTGCTGHYVSPDVHLRNMH